MNTESLLTLLQFSDGLFPVGAYAHSFGLESYVQEGVVRDATGVEHFIAAQLECSVAPTDSVIALCSCRAARAGDREACLRLDAALESMRCARELREASRQMGRQTLRVARCLLSPGMVSDFFEAVEEERTPGHHAVAFGMVGSEMGWPPQDMTCAYLYSASSALVNAAIRLFPLGQLAGQQILFRMVPLIARLAAELAGKTETDLWSFAPAQEIAVMRHATLEARLFRS